MTTDKNHDPVDFQVSLKVLLKNKTGEYLCLNVAKRDNIAPLSFDLPGGRINKDEMEVPFHELINREVTEEVGEDIKYKLREDPVSIGQWNIPENIEVRHGETRGRFFVLFEAEYISGSVEISDEHSGFKWLKLTKKDTEKFSPLLRSALNNYFDWN